MEGGGSDSEEVLHVFSSLQKSFDGEQDVREVRIKVATSSYVQFLAVKTKLHGWVWTGLDCLMGDYSSVFALGNSGSG